MKEIIFFIKLSSNVLLPRELPQKAKNYIIEIEKFIQTKISSISTSPERNDTILIENPFKI